MAIKQPTDKSYFVLPDLGEGVHEAELIRWRVKPGEPVDEYQTLAEMETDKALVEVPSPWAGQIAQLHGAEGDIITVGSKLVSYGDVPADAAAAPAETATATAEAPAQREDSGTVVGSVQSSVTIPQQFARRETAAPVVPAGRALATPAVRRVAREIGVDINRVPGTGRGGRVTASDVHACAGGARGGPAVAPAAAMMAPLEAPAPAITPDGVTKRVPIRGVRRTIAAALRRSVQTAVHFTVVDEADITALDRRRQEYAMVLGRKLSILPFLMVAVIHGLRRHPTLNANVDDDREELLLKGPVNLGCAVDTDHGLMVPVIENAQTLSPVQLDDTVRTLAAACRDRTIARESLVGGTFTISNVGSYGGLFTTPIINYPEVAILGVGRSTERVLTRGGTFYAGLVLPLSLTCDHRVVDGAEGARFLQTVRSLLESPDEMLGGR